MERSRGETVADLRGDRAGKIGNRMRTDSVTSSWEMGRFAELARRIRAREAKVAVVGLGYVGLPLLVAASDAGFRVIGFDLDEAKLERLRSGHSHIVDIDDAQVSAIEDPLFSADPSVLEAADVVSICVPTPLTDHSPDLSSVRQAAHDVGRGLSPGHLVILESTTYPGTTEEIVAPILNETSGLRAGSDFALAYSPERIDPGQPGRGLKTTPKVVAGLTSRCREVAMLFYSTFVKDVVPTSTPREAEMAKLVENTFRQVNIALVNELAMVANELEVDIWEALRVAATKPFGYMAFWPGPGVGGHCISIDPSYLSWRASQRRGYRMGFIEHANEVNRRMPDYVVSRIAEALNDAGKPLRGSQILAVGAAYKGGVDDIRESPALTVMELLGRKGAVVSFHDPYLPRVVLEDRIAESVDLTPVLVQSMDCVVILTAHPDVDYSALARQAQLVFDARGVTAGTVGKNVIRL